MTVDFNASGGETHLTDLEQRNHKIIDAVIEKAKIVCPGSLAMIGVYFYSG